MVRTLLVCALGLAMAATGLAAVVIWWLLTDPIGLVQAASRGLGVAR